jgi:transcriptional regulator with XRE-family HTH domain
MKPAKTPRKPPEQTQRSAKRTTVRSASLGGGADRPKKTRTMRSEAGGPPAAVVLRLRHALGLDRKQLARVVGVAERTLASWEQGEAVPDPGRRKLHELQHLYRGLTRVLRGDAVPEWLVTPCEQFEGASALQLLERGEIDRIRQMIYYLESGMPT